MPTRAEKRGIGIGRGVENVKETGENELMNKLLPCREYSGIREQGAFAEWNKRVSDCLLTPPTLRSCMLINESLHTLGRTKLRARRDSQGHCSRVSLSTRKST